jgi:hypothetical protein
MLNSLVMGWLGGLFGSRTEAPEKEKEALGGDDDPDPWIVVLSAFDIVQATIARARLEDEAIPCRMRQEGASAALPVSVGILGRIDVLVPESLQERALDVLAAVPTFDSDPDDEATDADELD